MEGFFIRILNVTLLICALVCFLIVCAALSFLILTIQPAFLVSTVSEHIAVSYKPANIVSAEGGADNPSVQGSDSDSGLSVQAAMVCSSLNAIFSNVSSGRLSLKDRDACRTQQVAQANQLGDRAENYLSEKSNYLKAAAGDGQARATVQAEAGGDIQSQAQKYVDDLTSRFDNDFHSFAVSDDERKGRKLLESVQAKANAMALAVAAAIAFFAFLIISFLLLAVRLEKNVSLIASKI